MEPRDSLPLLGFRCRRRTFCCAPRAVKNLCRHRASKRWSALLTQTKSRIGFNCGMRKRLGEHHWTAFVRYANAHYKAQFIDSLTPASGILGCCGSIDGRPCPNHISIDLAQVTVEECGTQLRRLHMDHTHDVKRICDTWSKALPEHPRSWDDGICGELIAHLLFGTEDHLLTRCSPRPIWQQQIVLRCGDVNGVQGQRAEDFCHDVANAHYEQTLRVEDVKWPSAPPATIDLNEDLEKIDLNGSGSETEWDEDF